MANTVIALKKSSIPSSKPASLANGELAINYADGKLYYKNTAGEIASFTSGYPSFGIVDANGTLLTAGVVNDVLTINAGDNIEITGDYLNNKFTVNANISTAFSKANDAYSLAISAFTKANTGGGPGGGASVNVGDVAPALPAVGDLWWNTSVGSLFVYYTDADSSQWVEANPTGGISGNLNIIADLTIANNFAGEMANSSNQYALYIETAGNNYTNAVGFSANTYALYTATDIGNSSNNYTNDVGTAGNNYAYAIVTSTNNHIIDVASSGNNYALFTSTSVGTAGNNYTDAVGAAGNNYTNASTTAGNNYTIAVGTAGNNYVIAVDASGNNWANLKVHTITSNSNARIWANAVTLADGTKTVFMDLAAYSGVSIDTFYGDSGGSYYPRFIVDTYGRIKTLSSVALNLTPANNRANAIGTAGNNYTDAVGSVVNTYSVSIGTAGNNYTNAVGSSGNAYALATATVVGTAGNNYTNAVGSSGNAYTESLVTSTYNYTNSTFTTIATGTEAFNKANAALANATGTFAGDLTVTGNLNAHILASSNGFIDLGPGSRPSYLEGRIYYDNVDKSLTVFNEESGFIFPIGQKEYIRVYNNTGSPIAKGKPVYATGYHTTTHHHPTIALADASDSNKYDVIGLAAADIPDASHGYVIVRGWIGGINTAPLTAGQRFHLGYAAPGSLVTVSPEYPNYPYDIGYCVVSDATNGYLYIDRQSHTQESIRVLGTARVGGDMTVEGDFTVLGTQTITSTTSLSVGTQYVYLGTGDSIPNANITFTGTGLNDLSFKGHYEGVGTTTFWVKITEANATGDYFSWSYDDFATVVSSNTLILYQTPQALSNGISVYFQSNTGHTIGSKWNASSTAVSTDSGFVTNHTDLGRYTHAGLFRDATDGTFKFFNSYDIEPAGNIDIANNTFSLGNVQVLKITADQIYAGATEIGSLIPLISDRANAAFSKANSANVLAYETGIGSNNWANTLVLNVSTAGNNYTNAVGTAGNNYTVATTSSVGTAGNNYTIALTAAGNNYAIAIGSSANTLAGVMANSANIALYTYANSVGSGANNQSGSMANSANIYGMTFANTKLSNTSGVSFAGNLYFPSGCVAIGIATTSYPVTITSGAVTPLSGLTGALVTAEGSANSTTQFNIRNSSNGTAASGDLIVTADDGTETTNFIDLGINNSGYNQPTFWTINGPRDGYLYTSDGNLSIGVANSSSTIKYVNFFLGGVTSADEVMRIQDSAGGANVGIGRTNPGYKLDVVGTVNATAVLVNGSPIGGLSNSTVTLQGDLTTTGTITTKAPLTANGVVYITPVAGLNEGGEINLFGSSDYPDWTIDSYQDNLRIFSGNANTMVVQLFNSGAGSMSLDVEGNLTVSGANVGYVASNAAIEFIIDGGGSAITPGQKGHIEVPFSGIIKQWTMLLDQSGSANVEIWKDSYANYPPTVADAIHASGFAVSAATKGQGSTFDKSSVITAGDILAYNVVSAATTTRVTISLKVTKT